MTKNLYEESSKAQHSVPHRWTSCPRCSPSRYSVYNAKHRVSDLEMLKRGNQCES